MLLDVVHEKGRGHTEKGAKNGRHRAVQSDPFRAILARHQVPGVLLKRPKIITLHDLGDGFSWCPVFSAPHCASTVVNFRHQRANFYNFKYCEPQLRAPVYNFFCLTHQYNSQPKFSHINIIICCPFNISPLKRISCIRSTKISWQQIFHPFT
jgi:hypothetical protein